ncbi:M48 family metalloprotease [Sphingopyxis sp. FBM22]|nr:M48 family metalloprotease [Sphingopyxis yananensis]MCC2602571.1 M48 family metalloprotease [Sphingopyxis yananensis]
MNDITRCGSPVGRFLRKNKGRTMANLGGKRGGYRVKFAALLAATTLGAISLTPSAQAQLKRIATANSITAQEKQQGAEAHPQLMQEFGGAYTGRQSPYVVQVGQNIAMQSGLGNARDFTVTLLNSPVNNAFAIPGGYIYVTRQLMALMNDEAELAGVLGHEVGHVAAQHSKKRQSAATRNTILGVLGAVVGGAMGDGGGLLGGLGGLLQNNAMKVAQLATLGFSRSQELQADQLGVQYLLSAGYDTGALATMLASLANQTALDARLAGTGNNSVPAWASTHPDPASRVRNAETLANRAGGTGRKRNADAFLAQVNGMTYGDDPAQGVVEGQNFIHPDMKLRFTAPSGYGLQNGTAAVTVSGNGGQAQFSMAPYNGDMNAYITNVMRAVAGKDSKVTPTNIQRTTVNGIPASYASVRANSQSGAVDLTVFAYEFSGNQAYHFVALTKAGGAGVFNSMFQSVRRLSNAEASAVRPRRVEVVSVKSGDTIASLSRRMAYDDLQQDRFLVLNRLASNARLSAGQKVKIVTYGTR